MKKTNQKTLLHSLPFAVWLLVCFCVQAQPADTQASLTAHGNALKAQYVQSLQTCSTQLASAQCKRQAGLDYKKAQHENKLKREALDVDTKRNNHSKKLAEKANNVATAGQGVDINGRPLERAPLSKQSHKKVAAAASPMSQPSGVRSNTPKARLSKQIKPLKNTAKGTSLTPQPSPEQRRSNVAKFASNEQAIAVRKAKVVQKKAKRQTKNDARRAAGLTVDSP